MFSLRYFLLLTAAIFLGCDDNGSDEKQSGGMDMSTSNSDAAPILREGDAGVGDIGIQANLDTALDLMDQGQTPLDGGSEVTDTDMRLVETVDAELRPTDASLGEGGGDGESCETAFDLVAQSRFDDQREVYQLAGRYGLENNYNPYSGADPSLPPSCSPVYDALGREVVYAVTLRPGERFHAWVEAPTELRTTIGLYFLSDCESASILDIDDSGACGNNEYSTPGNCNVFGACQETHEWLYVYPEFVGGRPTETRRMYLVIDEVARDLGGSFAIEWRLEDEQGNLRFPQ